jgi:2,5-diamino-6-(ribosylamino)-4(3H)-pyrimidinone 5'-phosphate reductase
MKENMLPKIILHNSISLDGSLMNFNVNMELHYQIAGSFKPDAHLIGSNTIKTGIELYGSSPPEEKKDFVKPKRDEKLPFWIIIDTKGSLHGLLHEVRRFDYCKDVIILISRKTPEKYIDYLKKRNYDFHIVGEDYVNLKKSLELFSKKYNVKRVLTDCGNILGNLLLNQGLINEISLLIHPIIVGDKSYNIFNNVIKDLQLKLIKKEILSNNLIWLYYKVKKNK